jgi:hypothetical protein
VNLGRSVLNMLMIDIPEGEEGFGANAPLHLPIISVLDDGDCTTYAADSFLIIMSAEQYELIESNPKEIPGIVESGSAIYFKSSEMLSALASIMIVIKDCSSRSNPNSKIKGFIDIENIISDSQFMEMIGRCEVDHPSRGRE